MGDHYEYITRYVDNLTVISRNPQELLCIIWEEHHFKLKGNELIRYHLGSNFSRDEEGVLCMSPTKYIKCMMDNYICMFGSASKTLYWSPLERGDHPELDTSDELDEEDTKKYQSLIGALQWVVTLGHFNIGTAVMTLSSFRANPRIGHLNRGNVSIVTYLRWSMLHSISKLDFWIIQQLMCLSMDGRNLSMEI